MSKVLVTGGAGFIGSHLVDALISSKHKVTVVDNLSSGKKENINPEAQFLNFDICSQKFTHTLNKIRPDVIYHLAAQSSISASFKNPKKDFNVNLFATLKLLDKAKEIKVKKVIFASSAAVFGYAKNLPTAENDSKEPLSYYGLSKLCCEYFFGNYYERFKLDYVALRFANVYGPKQGESGEGGVVAIFAGNIIKKKPLVIYGSGNQSRDFIYVSDIVDALVKSLNKNVNGTFNVGTSVQTSINQLAKKLISIYSQNPVKIIHKPQRFLEVGKSALSYQEFKQDTEFRPKVSLDKGLQKTLNYFKNIATL